MFTMFVSNPYSNSAECISINVSALNWQAKQDSGCVVVLAIGEVHMQATVL